MNQLEQLKALKEGFTVDNRVYKFNPMPFKIGKKILAYMTTVANEIDSGQLGFIDTPKFENDIEPLLVKYTTVDGFNLNTLEAHFDEHPSDYFQFVVNSLQGFAAPFLPENNISSSSLPKSDQPVILKKQM